MKCMLRNKLCRLQSNWHSSSIRFLLARYPIFLRYEHTYSISKALHSRLNCFRILVNFVRKPKLGPVRLLWHNFLSSRIMPTFNVETKVDMLLSILLSWIRRLPPDHWNQRRCPKNPSCIRRFLDLEKVRMPSTACSMQSIRNIKSLHPKNVVQIDLPLRLTQW